MRFWLGCHPPTPAIQAPRSDSNGIDGPKPGGANQHISYRCAGIGQYLESLDAADRMAKRLPAAPDMMARHRSLAEYPFGQIKHRVMDDASLLQKGLGAQGPKWRRRCWEETSAG